MIVATVRLQLHTYCSSLALLRLGQLHNLAAGALEIFQRRFDVVEVENVALERLALQRVDKIVDPVVVRRSGDVLELLLDEF